MSPTRPVTTHTTIHPTRLYELLCRITRWIWTRPGNKHRLRVSAWDACYRATNLNPPQILDTLPPPSHTTRPDNPIFLPSFFVLANTIDITNDKIITHVITTVVSTSLFRSRYDPTKTKNPWQMLPAYSWLAHTPSYHHIRHTHTHTVVATQSN